MDQRITSSSSSAPDALRDAERAKYDTVWRLPQYRVACHGLRLWRAHRDLFPERVGSALDIGCGTGRLFAQWLHEGIDGWGVDISAEALDEGHPAPARRSVQCLWEMEFDRSFELGVCADVMEHIPPERVDDVLARIAATCETTVLQIANYPSSFRHGGALHLTLHDPTWWLATLRRFGAAEFIPFVRRQDIEEYVFRLTP